MSTNVLRLKNFFLLKFFLVFNKIQIMEEDNLNVDGFEDGEILNAAESQDLDSDSDSTIHTSWGTLDEEIYEANSYEIYSSIYDSEDDNYFKMVQTYIGQSSFLKFY